VIWCADDYLAVLKLDLIVEGFMPRIAVDLTSG